MILDNYKRFTKIDDANITECFKYNTGSVDEAAVSVAKGLGANLHTIIQRAFQLGVIKYAPFSPFLLSHRREGWRSDEINVLIDNRNVCRKLLGRALDRSSSSVSKQMHCMRLMNGGYDYDWSEPEIIRLHQLADTHTIRQLSDILKRSAIDIKHQCIEQGLQIYKAGEEFTQGGLTREKRAFKKQWEVTRNAGI
jgi:hypothetical protein